MYYILQYITLHVSGQLCSVQQYSFPQLRRSSNGRILRSVVQYIHTHTQTHSNNIAVCAIHTPNETMTTTTKTTTTSLQQLQFNCIAHDDGSRHHTTNSQKMHTCMLCNIYVHMNIYIQHTVCRNISYYTTDESDLVLCSWNRVYECVRQNLVLFFLVRHASLIKYSIIHSKKLVSYIEYVLYNKYIARNACDIFSIFFP